MDCEIDSRISDELQFHHSIFVDNKEQRDNTQIGNVLLISIVTRYNRLGAKNARSYQYRGKRNKWLL